MIQKVDYDIGIGLGLKYYKRHWFYPVAGRLLQYVYRAEIPPLAERIPLNDWMYYNCNVARISINYTIHGEQELYGVAKKPVQRDAQTENTSFTVERHPIP